VHVNQPVLLLEPARNTYGHAIPKDMPPGSRYRAILGDRPRPGAYASVSSHQLRAGAAATARMLRLQATVLSLTQTLFHQHLQQAACAGSTHHKYQQSCAPLQRKQGRHCCKMFPFAIAITQACRTKSAHRLTTQQEVTSQRLGLLAALSSSSSMVAAHIEIFFMVVDI
jgi:hypothetical protein